MRPDSHGGGTNISGDISGTVTNAQVAVGVGNVIRSQHGEGTAAGLDAAELAEVRALFASLREHVRAGAPADERDAACARVDEAEAAVTGDEVDPTTIALVRRWFARHLPAFAGALGSVLVHPLVGRVLEAAGESLTSDQ